MIDDPFAREHRSELEGARWRLSGRREKTKKKKVAELASICCQSEASQKGKPQTVCLGRLIEEATLVTLDHL